MWLPVTGEKLAVATSCCEPECGHLLLLIILVWLFVTDDSVLLMSNSC